MDELASRLDVPLGPEFDGFDVFVVGGAVRDALRGHDPDDIDLMAVPRPGEIANPIDVLEDRMTFIDPSSSAPVFQDSHGREVALPRSEDSNGVGFHDFDFHVVPAGTPVDDAVERDLERRDFTVNAMAFSLRENRLFDPFDGHCDLLDGVLRPVSDAFREDPLRVVRAARFAPRLNASLSPELIEMSREIANQRVSKVDQLLVLATGVDESDQHLAWTLQEIACEATSETELIDRVDELGNPVLGERDVREAIREDMSPIEILPDERILMELRKVSKQTDNPGRFFRVLRKVDALEDSFPILATLPDADFDRMIEQINHVRQAVGPDPHAVFAGMGDALDPDQVAAFSDAHTVQNSEAAVLYEAGDGLIRRVGNAPSLSADELVVLATRLFGDHGLSPDDAIAAAVGLAEFENDPIDVDAVRHHVMQAGTVLDEIDGQAVMEAKDIDPDDIGTQLRGDEFGELVAEMRTERLRDMLRSSE